MFGSVAVLPQDCYYRSLTDEQKELAYKADFNFDHPSAFDFDNIHTTLTSIREGATETSVPAYDYTTHSVKSNSHKWTRQQLWSKANSHIIENACT